MLRGVRKLFLCGAARKYRQMLNIRVVAQISFMVILLSTQANAEEPRNTTTDSDQEEVLSAAIKSHEYEFARMTRLIRETLMYDTLGDIAYMEKIYLTGPPVGNNYTNHRIEKFGAGAFVRENPLRFSMYVFVPREYANAGKPLPLIIYPHGGVHSNFQIGGGHMMRELLAQGYIVAAPDYRGSTGYGEKFFKAIDYGGKEIEDTKAARDFMVNNYTIVDKNRVGIIGHSHGGLHTLMNLFRYPDAYKVGFADVPVSDLIARMGYKTERYRDLYSAEYHIGKTAYEATQEYMRRSPVWNAEKLRTPLLIYTNTNDEDVNVLEVRNLIRALKAEGKKFQYEIYKNIPGGHRFLRMDHKVSRQARFRVYKFLAQYLTPLNPFKDIRDLEKSGYLFHGR